MKITSSISIIVLLILVTIPIAASATTVNIEAKANQKSVEVIINEQGDVHVKHIVSPSGSPKQVELIDGVIENLIITDEEGQEITAPRIGNNDAVIIYPSDKDSIIEYDLREVLLFADNTWRLDFLYLETTKFLVPQSLDLLYVNNRPVYLDDKKGFACHGCQMVLEYSLNVPTKIMKVDWEDKKFLVEFNTFMNIQDFDFNQSQKEINFTTDDSNQFITIILPLELLWGPYATFLNDQKIYFNQDTNNGTHVWLDMKIDTPGEISIVGTTVVPEFPIIIPLVIVGFVMVMTVSRIKKFSLH